MEEEITAFRDLYRKVRYGEKEETEAFKREAREIYKKVKKRGCRLIPIFSPDNKRMRQSAELLAFSGP